MSKHIESSETQNQGPYEFETRSKLAGRVSATGFVAAGLVILGGLVGGGAWAVTAVTNPQLAEQVSNFDPNAPLDGGFAIEDPNTDDSGVSNEVLNGTLATDPTASDPSATPVDPTVVPPVTFGNGDDEGDDQSDDQSDDQGDDGDHHSDHGSSWNANTDPSAAPTFSSDDSGDDQSDDQSDDSGSDD